MHIPHYLKEDVLLTETCFNNHLPPSPLGGTIPLQCLYLDPTLLICTPTSFCLHRIFPRSLPCLSKISPLALKGISVNYLYKKKGHGVCICETHGYLASSNVTVNEDTLFFPFSLSPSWSSFSPPPRFAHVPSLIGSPLHIVLYRDCRANSLMTLP